MLPDLKIENSFTGLVAGVDEAGRGALCGPVVAAAVILPKNFDGSGINDSKKLTPEKRAKAYDYITSIATFGVGIISHTRIDKINILQATFEAMLIALDQIIFDYAIIDGNQLPKKAPNFKAIIKGDSLSLSIAAASIIAKHTRDTLMKDLALVHNQYGIDKHQGYATQLHRDLILLHGPSPIHRKTFLKKLYAPKQLHIL